MPPTQLVPAVYSEQDNRWLNDTKIPKQPETFSFFFLSLSFSLCFPLDRNDRIREGSVIRSGNVRLPLASVSMTIIREARRQDLCWQLMDLKGKEKVRGGYPVPEVGGGLYLSARDGSEHKVTGWGLIESGSQMGKQSRPASFIFSCFGVALQSGDAVPSLNGVGGHLPPESIYLVSRRLSAFVSQSTWVQQLVRNRCSCQWTSRVAPEFFFFVEWRTEPAIKDIFVGIILRMAISSCSENN